MDLPLDLALVTELAIWQWPSRDSTSPVSPRQEGVASPWAAAGSHAVPQTAPASDKPQQHMILSSVHPEITVSDTPT